MAIDVEGRGPLGRPRIDIAGQRYGKLVAQEIACVRGGKGRQVTYWQCLCDCGETTIVRLAELRAGNTKSCGCLRVESGKSNRTHGGKGTRLYRIWKGMRSRCLNPNATSFENYGGRGITVCEEWRQSFEAFQQWSLGNGYADELTIDRINNDGGYEPGNCRWATWSVQLKNRRKRKAA